MPLRFSAGGRWAVATALGFGVWLSPAAAGEAKADNFPSESEYDTAVHADEALVNVRVRNHRWPDCYSLQTAAADIYRLEGVAEAPDATEAKALAAWRWLLTLMSISGGRVFEGNPTGKWVRCHGDRDVQQIEVRRGDKLILVYGVHECGGLSRALAHLWRAGGYLGYQEPSSGHSVACLRYPDADGVWRMHSFNPQGMSYYWNPRDKRVGTRRRPVLRGVEYKRFLPPMEHTLRTSLRRGEAVRRRWSNDGYVQMTQRMGYWKKRPKHKQIASHCVAGQEDQVLTAVAEPKTFRGQLWPASRNVACSAPGPGRAALHPAEAGQAASFVYRLASPYVAIEAAVEATLKKARAADVCRLAFSNNMGRSWHVLCDKKAAGEETVRLEVGRKRYWQPAPSITSHYSFLIKAEFRTDGDPRRVGMDALKVVVHRQLNMRALPNLMPGENVIQVAADALRPDLALQLDVEYEVNGKPRAARRVIRRFPHFFRIDVTGLPAEKLKTPHYLANWGGKATFNLPEHPLRMKALSLCLIPAAGASADESMPADRAEAFFRKAYPTPYKHDRRMADESKVPEHESEVSGFFPQLPRTKDAPAEPLAYYNWLIARIGTSDVRLPKLPAGTDPIQWCIEKLPRASGGRTTGICNVLAHFADKRALPALLAKWAAAPKYGPGDRYVPDALAAIGDRSAAAALAGSVRRLRFDYRVHVARALGILGGPEARRTLELLAAKDPNISVRGQARRALEAMDKPRPHATGKGRP